MARFYYKCPLEAAYMAKNYGVSFLRYRTWEEILEGLEDCHSIEADRADEKYFIEDEHINFLELHYKKPHKHIFYPEMEQ